MHANYSKLVASLGLPAVRLAACFSLSLHEAAEPPCPWHLFLQFPTSFLLSISTLSVTSVQSLRAYRVLCLRMHQKPITKSPQGELVLMCVKQSITHGAEGLVSSPALRMSLGPTSHGHEREWATFRTVVARLQAGAIRTRNPEMLSRISVAT